MKQGIHPEYRFVVFKDISAGTQFITKSTIQTKQTAEVDGVEYPMVVVDISSDSHPFYTGSQKLMDTEGRVEKFYKKYGFAKPSDDS